MIIYIVIDKDIVKYVGKTKNHINARISSHISDMNSRIGQYIRNHPTPKDIRIICYLIPHRNSDLGVERYLIRIYNPKFNTQYAKRGINKNAQFIEDDARLSEFKKYVFPLSITVPNLKCSGSEFEISQINRRIFDLLEEGRQLVDDETFRWAKKEIKSIARELHRLKL